MMKIAHFFVLLWVISLAVWVGEGTASANAGDDTLRTATTITNTGAVSGVLNGTYDVDFYTFTAPGNGLLMIKMSNEGNRKSVDILDENGESVFSNLTTDNGALGDKSRNVGLKKGQKVFMKIQKSGYDNVSYKLNVSFKKGNNYEKENNDTIRKANSILATSITTGELQGGADNDYFKFTLKSAGNINLKMSNAGQSKKISIFNSQQVELVSFTTSDDRIGNASRDIGLAKGVYYVKVENNFGYYIPYILHSKYTKSNYYEKEVNDSLRTANTMTLNKNYKGVVKDWFDNDYFKFNVTKKRSVKIYLNNSGEKKSVELYTSKGEKIAGFSSNPALNNSVFLKATLNKGTYYLRLNNHYTNNTPYVIRVK